MGRAKGTLRWHTTCLERFLRWCDTRDLVYTDSVTKQEIRLYWAYLRENYKGAKTAASSVRAFFMWLEAEGEQDINPVKQAGFPKKRRETIKPLTSHEIEALIAATRTGRNPLRDSALILLMYGTGLRISEVLSIQERELDFEHAQVTVLGKGAKTRTVSFPYRTTRALKQYKQRERPRNHEPYLFLTEEGGQFFRRSARLMLRRFGRKVGLEPSRVNPPQVPTQLRSRVP